MEHLSPSALRHDAVQYRQVFHVKVPEGATVADLMRPRFWNHQGSRVKPGDLIDCVAVDGSFDVTLRVLAVSESKTDVTMRALRIWEAPVSKLIMPKDSPLDISFTDGSLWRVIRRADDAELKRGFPMKSDAIAWALDTLRVAA